MLSFGEKTTTSFLQNVWFIQKILQFLGVYIGDACNNIVLPIEVHAVVKQIILPSAYRTTVTFGVFCCCFQSKNKTRPVQLLFINEKICGSSSMLQRRRQQCASIELNVRLKKEINWTEVIGLKFFGKRVINKPVSFLLVMDPQGRFPTNRPNEIFHLRAPS